METLCEGNGCRRSALQGGKYALAEPGQHLCRHCQDRLADEIRTLPQLYAACESVLAQGALTGVRERTTGGPLPGLTLNMKAVEARDAIVAVLSSWSDLVVQERDLAAPGMGIGVLARLLVTHLSWLASHPAAGDLSTEIAQTARAARRASDPEPAKRITIGACVVRGCDGKLSATVHSRHAAQVQCSANSEHAWDTHEWTRLRREMEGPGSPGRRTLAHGGGHSPAVENTDRHDLPAGERAAVAPDHPWRTSVLRGKRRACLFYVPAVLGKQRGRRGVIAPPGSGGTRDRRPNYASPTLSAPTGHTRAASAAAVS